MSDHDQPNELFDSPAFLTMPEESWPREEAGYTADVYAAPPDEEAAGGKDSPAAVAVARARALLEEAANLSQWRHLPDQVHVRTREAVWALCVAVEALEGMTLHEAAPDLAAERASLIEERDQLRDARDVYHAELASARAEIALLRRQNDLALERMADLAGENRALRARHKQEAA